MLNLPTILKGVNSWPDLEKKLAPTDNQTKGAVFEYLTKKFLEFDPRYAAKLKLVWLLKEVPTAVAEKLKLPKTDQGIDLICETHEGDFWSVQCKFLSDADKKISHRQISTFMSLSFGLSKKITFGLICTTVDDYAAIYRGKSNIGFVLADSWQKLREDFFHFARGDRKIQTPPKLTPRPHQTKAISAAERHFIKGKETRGKLVFPCGAGKSLAGYWIARKFAAKSIVVAVPSLALVKQTLETWLVQASADKFSLRWLCVCSDETIGKNGLRADDIHVGARPSTSLSNDDVVIHTQDLGVPCVTDPALIAGWLKHNKNQAKVIFTTYQSARALGEAVRKLTNHSPSPLAGRGASRAGWGFDLGILDEAHKTVGANDKLFSYLLYDNNVKIRRRIFMTATERRYSGSSDNIVSMDDADLFGDTFEHMSFAHAVDAGILSDYKIVTLAVSNQDIADAVKDNSLSKDGVEARSYAALVALRKAMQKYPIHHAVSFHGSIAKAQDFKRQQDTFSAQHPEFSPLETFHVSGKDATAKRSKIVAEFTQSPSALITNAKCLTEGVDVPKIDAVLFADPRRSKVDIVQAVGRALRKSPGKKSGYVILPLFTGRWPATAGDATGDAILESDDFKEIIQTLRALASNDERIVEYFRDVSKGKTPRGKLIEFDIDAKATANFDADDLVRELQLRTWNLLAKLNWRPFEEAREFVRGLGLVGLQDWLQYCKSPTRPADIPTNPHRTYADTGWLNLGDWLGTGRIAARYKVYRDFGAAKTFVQKLKFKKQKEWQQYCLSGQKPDDIPASPEKTYKLEGWAGYGDWLGTGVISSHQRKYRSFAAARKFARTLNLKSRAEWEHYSQSGKKPADIPFGPHIVYKDDGWQGIGDWLGTGSVAKFNREYMSFTVARKFVRELKLNSTKEWYHYCRTAKKPKDIPGHPDRVYAKKGWISFGDWLGTGRVADQLKEFRDFTEARKFAKSLKLKSRSEWQRYAKLGKKPRDIPATPDKAYKNKGWLGYGDWLGTGTIAPQNLQFRSYEATKQFFREKGISTRSEWARFRKSGNKPKDIPAAVERVYKSEWRGWPDFLGTVKGKPAKKPRKKK